MVSPIHNSPAGRRRMVYVFRNLCSTVIAVIAFVSVGTLASAAPADTFPVPAGFTSRSATVDGTTIHYVVGGRGPTVFLVHGFGSTWYEWRHLMPVLKHDHTVVAIDLPGLGQSSPPRNGYDGQAVSNVLFGFFEELSPKRKFDLVAHDIGIWLTYPLAVEHQDRISRMAFMEAPIPDRTIYTFPAFTPKGESLVWHFSFFAALGALPETLVAGHYAFFLEHFIREHATQQEAFDHQFFVRDGQAYAGGPWHSAMQYYRALNTDVVENRTIGETKLVIPMLLLAGGGHGGFGAFQLKEVRPYATNITNYVLAGCGHWLPDECPQMVDFRVTRFLAGS